MGIDNSQKINSKRQKYLKADIFFKLLFLVKCGRKNCCHSPGQNGLSISKDSILKVTYRLYFTASFPLNPGICFPPIIF